MWATRRVKRRSFHLSQAAGVRSILRPMRSSLALKGMFALLLAAAFFFSGCGKKDGSAGGDEFLRLSNVGKAHPTFAQLSFPPPEFSLAA